MCVATLCQEHPSVVVALFLMHRTRSNEPYLTKWIIATALFATTLQVGLLKFPQAERGMAVPGHAHGRTNAVDQPARCPPLRLVGTGFMRASWLTRSTSHPRDHERTPATKST